MYQPALMENTIIAPWPAEMEEYVFASHTCLITQGMIIEELKDKVE